MVCRRGAADDLCKGVTGPRPGAPRSHEEHTVNDELTIPVEMLDEDPYPFEKLSRLAPRPQGSTRPRPFFYAPVAAMAPRDVPICARIPR